ncbi:type II toxin-antitoxin system VapB family antitoxin [Sphingomonas cannabina]|uniref:type II toxin-antitoxin system VapB family antitoxin n=1 Tax=Sphingomonas cannabina TaxID=2899123 RepID=UPI001F3D8AC6|nr:type II toxin-antitoxin system VapB family antitoxin [Sphingomonas cannabina]UIJ45875.1 type II toxin-antitoxin system VapB family antitoxin [Sphingomonas cannabina]
MASLYIKDGETAELASRIARRLGTTKTEAVRRALLKVEAELGPQAAKQSTVEWLREYRRDHPLPPPTGLKADKAFFDELWGEDPD